jgi:hypothetical protein
VNFPLPTTLWRDNPRGAAPHTRDLYLERIEMTHTGCIFSRVETILVSVPESSQFVVNLLLNSLFCQTWVYSVAMAHDICLIHYRVIHKGIYSIHQNISRRHSHSHGSENLKSFIGITGYQVCEDTVTESD